jgi:hypothetical protein
MGAKLTEGGFAEEPARFGAGRRGRWVLLDEGDRQFIAVLIPRGCDSSSISCLPDTYLDLRRSRRPRRAHGIGAMHLGYVISGL